MPERKYYEVVIRYVPRYTDDVKERAVKYDSWDEGMAFFEEVQPGLCHPTATWPTGIPEPGRIVRIRLQAVVAETVKEVPEDG